jgi:hypothetical protein
MFPLWAGSHRILTTFDAGVPCQLDHSALRGLFHLFAAALRAISVLRSEVILAALAFPPRLPSSAAARLARSVSGS